MGSAGAADDGWRVASRSPTADPAAPRTARVGIALAVALLPAAVLALDPGGWYPFGPAKWLAVSVLLPLAAALVLWSLPVRIASMPTIATACLAGWFGLAAVLGLDGRYAWLGTPERHFGMVIWVGLALAFVIGQQLDPERDRIAIQLAVVVTGVGLTAAGVAQASPWAPSVLAVDDRWTGPLGSAAFLGAAAGLVLPLLLGIVLDRDLGRGRDGDPEAGPVDGPARDARAARWLRSGAGVGAAGTAAALVGSGARAAWFGLAVAAVATLVVRRDDVVAAVRLRPRLAGVAAAMAVVALAVLVLITPVGTRIGALADRDAAGGSSRLDEWRVAARVISNHPLTGVGPEGYRIAFAEGTDDAYEQAHGRDPLPDRAHSAPLDVAVTGGLPALVAWAVVWGFIVRSAVRAIRRRRPWVAGIGAALLAHLAGQLLLFPTAELEPFAWVLGGLVVALDRPSVGPDGVAARIVTRAVAVAVAAVAVLAAVSGVAEVRSDRHAAAAAAALARGDTSTALAWAEEAVAAKGDVVRLQLLLARVRAADRQGTRSALLAVDAVLTTSPRDPVVQRERLALLVVRASSTHLPDDVTAARTLAAALTAADPANAALALLAGSADRLGGDAGEAERRFLRAEALAPRDSAASLALAALYLDTGRPDDARRAADRALARTPDDPDARAVRARIGP